MGKHGELVKFELKNYYIWRAALGNISKKTNHLPCSHHNTYLTTESLRVIDHQLGEVARPGLKAASMQLEGDRF